MAIQGRGPRLSGDRGRNDRKAAKAPSSSGASDTSARKKSRSAEGQKSRERATEKKKKKRSGLGIVIEVVGIVVAAFVIAMLVQFFLVKPFTIHQVSMEPTLVEGDRILLSRLTYHFRDPEAGDVVVFHSPVREGEDLVKRVVAVGGDEVSIHDGALYVNGAVQEEPYLNDLVWPTPDLETSVPEGSVFVMGDNRNNSGDSRVFGPVSLDAIMGEAFAVYWPLSHLGGL
jgi:signal peptidase I